MGCFRDLDNSYSLGRVKEDIKKDREGMIK